MSNAIPKLPNRVLKKYKFPLFEHYDVLDMNAGLQLKTITTEIGAITVTAIVDKFPIANKFRTDLMGNEVPINNNVSYRYGVRKHRELIEANTHHDFERVRARLQYFGAVA